MRLYGQLQAPLIQSQAQEVQQLAGGGLAVGDELFICHIENRSRWQHAAPVSDQARVLGVVRRQVSEIKREIPCAAEWLEVTRQAGIHRVAAHEDEAGV